MEMSAVRAAVSKVNSILADQAAAIRERGQISVDMNALSQHAVEVLDARLAAAVSGPISQVGNRLSGFEHEVASLGAKRVAEVRAEFEQISACAEAATKAAWKATQSVEQLTSRVTWATAGRLAAGLVPLAAVLLVIGGLTMGIAHALGVGPILGWAWSSFERASTWSEKVLIAIGTLGGIGLATFGTFKAGSKLHKTFHRW